METPKRVLRNLHLADAQEVNTPFVVPASPLLKTLGYGTGVNVYCLERSPRPTGHVRSPWAIKRVSKRVRANNKENKKLLNDRIVREAQLLRQLKHPNIVGFRAITQKDGVDTLALECCTSSLGLILENRLEQDLDALPANHIKKVVFDISSALDYLHTDAKMLHGDLKSYNVLVKGDFEICKLCDFGVSLPLVEGIVNFKENADERYMGTDLWCAPEVVNAENIIDSKADIFSFGLIIYETIALVPPHTLDLNDSKSEFPNEENDVSLQDCDVTEKPGNFTLVDMACGTRPPLPHSFALSDNYNIVLELFYLCTNSIPEERPSAKIIHESLANEELLPKKVRL